MPLSFGSVAYVSREAKLEPQRCEFLLASPNPKMLVSNAKFAPRSKVKGASLSADSVAYAASAPKGANKVPSREVGTKTLSSANYLRHNAKNKALMLHHPMLKAKLPRLCFQTLLALSSRLATDLQV